MPEIHEQEQLKSESLSTKQGSPRGVTAFLTAINNVPSYKLFLIYILGSPWLQHCYYNTKVFKYCKR